MAFAASGIWVPGYVKVLFFCFNFVAELKKMSAPAPKAAASDPLPHPPKEQLPDISYCITSPPPWREFLFIFASPRLFLLQTFSVYP